MTKPVDGAEALAREAGRALRKQMNADDGPAGIYRLGSDKGEKLVIAAMLAHSAALIAENQRLRSSLSALRGTLQCIANEQGDTVLGRRCIAAIGKSRVQPAARTALETRNG